MGFILIIVVNTIIFYDENDREKVESTLQNSQSNYTDRRSV